MTSPLGSDVPGTASASLEKLNVTKKRDTSVDVVCGLAILGVVFIHAHGMMGADWSPVAVWWRWGVPVFVAFAAKYASASLRKASATQYVKHRLWRLTVPFVVFSSIYFVIGGDWSSMTLMRALTKHWSGYGWSGQYFFIILFQLAVIWPLVGRYKPSGRLVVLTVALSVLIAPAVQWGFHMSLLLDKVGDRPVVFWVPFVVVGLWLSSNTVTCLSSRVLGMLALLGLAFVSSLIWVEMIAWQKVGVSSQIYLQSSTVLSGSLWAVYGPAAVKASGMLNGIDLALAYLGRWSLGIFCLNPLMIHGIQMGLPRIPEAIALNVQSWSPLILVSLVVLACLAVCHLLAAARLSILVR